MNYFTCIYCVTLIDLKISKQLHGTLSQRLSQCLMNMHSLEKAQVFTAALGIMCCRKWRSIWFHHSANKTKGPTDIRTGVNLFGKWYISVPVIELGWTVMHYRIEIDIHFRNERNTSIKHYIWYCNLNVSLLHACIRCMYIRIENKQISAWQLHIVLSHEGLSRKNMVSWLFLSNKLFKTLEMKYRFPFYTCFRHSLNEES